MAGETLGTIRGEMVLDVKKALSSYTQARQAHVATVVALQTGAGAMIQSGAAIAGVGATMLAGFGVAIGAAAEFEKRLDFFTAVSNTTQAEYDAIREKALQLGADTIYSANQIADSFIELGKSGVKAQDIINGIGEGVAALGAAADIPLDTAANIITAAVATFQLGADNAVMVADRLAGAANASIVDVEDLGVALKYAGGVAASLKIPFEDVNTALAILGVNGIKGSTAGTSLRQVLLSLNGSTAKAKNALEELGIITEDGGNKFFTAEGKAKSLAEVFQILQDATAGMSDQQRTAVMQQIFATRSLPSLIALTREGADGFREMAAAINETTALDVASKRLDNLAGDVEILRGNLETMFITSGSGFQTFARFIVQGVTDMIQVFLDLPGWAQTATTGTVAAFGGILVVVGTIGLVAGAILNIIALALRMGPVWAALLKVWIAVSGAIRLASAAMLATPLGLIITAVLLLVGALVVLWNTSEGFRNAVQPLFDGLIAIFQALGPIAATVLGAISTFLTGLAGSAATGLGAVVGWLGQLATTVSGALSVGIATVLPPLLSLINSLIVGLMPVLQTAIPLLTTVGQIFAALFSGNIADLSGLMTTLSGQITAFVGSIATTLIPGIIQVITDVIVAIIGMAPVLVEAGVGLFTSLITAAAQILPLLVGAAVQLITTLATSLISMIPTLITTALQLILSLVTALVTLLPMLIQAAITLFTGLITGLTTIIPMLITSIVQLIPVLIQAIVSAIPLLITAAIQLFLGLVLGIVEALPQIITALIDALIQIVTTLVDALPLIIDAAIQLFLGLVLGLLQALPQIITAVVEAIPQIITALVGMIPQIIDAAIQLFLGLVTGLAEALPQIIEAVIAAIPQIVTALIDAVPLLVDAGVQLIQGLIDGIISMGGALWDAAVGVAESALDAVTGFFGIASPSKLMFEQGEYWGQGLIGGILSNASMAYQAALTVAEAVASVPFEMAGLQEMYNSLNATKALQTQLGSAQLSIEANQLLALNDRMEEGTGDTIYDIDVYNPEPEPASESLPNALRAAAFMVG